MGLITKVRSRVKSSRHGLVDFSNTPTGLFYNLIGCSKPKKNCCYDLHRNPETILILLLLPLMMGRIGLLYACVIYQYPLHTIWEWGTRFLEKIYTKAKPLASKFQSKLDKCESSFVNMNLYMMVNQMVFFTVCDKTIGLEEKQRVTSMYSLLFYNVLAYCFCYVKEVVEKEDWNMNVNLTPSSQIRHLAMSATKVVLEWTKAVTFIVTVVCMLLVLGLEQGLEHYCPTRWYLIITLSYYILTEKCMQDSLPNLLTYIPYPQVQDRLVGLEKLYATLIIKFIIVTSNVIMLVPNLYSPKLTLITLYINVYLQYKSLNTLKNKLESEESLVSSFRFASEDELTTLDDVCAICLSTMKQARVTPCQHLFHTNCLRLCVKSLSNCCPICKRDLHFD